MKTKTLPVILMLVAGAIACILGFVYHYETTDFFAMVLIVLVVFYMLGCIAKGVIDKNFADFGKKDEIKPEESEEKENIESESDKEADE